MELYRYNRAKIFFFKDNLWSKSIVNNAEEGIQSTHYFDSTKVNTSVLSLNVINMSEYMKWVKKFKISKKRAILMTLITSYLRDEEPYVHLKAF